MHCVVMHADNDPVSLAGLNCYLVGGAVRDELLGRPVKERDWVVVGATADEMTAAGFTPVGKDFPVFLHPDSHEEYALARTERKAGHGYHGFTVYASPDVSLEDDLIRRDLTINAMARDADGNIIDPHGGQADLDNRVLRHVSDAFGEDPLRVLRIARFAARYADLGFSVHPDTQALMARMVDDGEVEHLVPERVWQETAKALTEDRPQVYFQVLRGCGALARLFPEIDCLFGVPQPERWHPEIDTGVHTMMVLEQAAGLSSDPVVRFAALLHDLGKGRTPSNQWPSHHGHEAGGVPIIRSLCERLRIPNAHRELGELVARYHLHVHKFDELRDDTLVKTLGKLDAWRRPERFEDFLTACEADARGRKGFEDKPYPQAEQFRRALEAANAIDVQTVIADGFSGKAIADELRKRRIRAVRLAREQCG